MVELAALLSVVTLGAVGSYSICSFTRDGSGCSLWGKVEAVLSVVWCLCWQYLK